MNEFIMVLMIMICWVFSIVIFCTGVSLILNNHTKQSYWCLGVSVSLMVVWIVLAAVWG